MSPHSLETERSEQALASESSNSSARVSVLAFAPDQPPARQWDLRQNCALRPRQLIGAYALLCVLIAAVGLAALAIDLPLIGLFAALNCIVVTIACVHYVRHVRDGEIVTLVGRTLLVEAYRARDVKRRVFDCTWLRVTHDGSPRSPVWLECGTARWPIGLHVGLDKRTQARRQMIEAIAIAAAR